ncbi:putative transposon-derived protein F52C9.6 [Aphis craccivora]|uniref:Putative transposon-derived protein F52C9.6 n=1 Tax=Aphis craccivora TaxID=307492 RepID=A0A6G0Z174_APHCR|nr:putative transposon-derived protein F52C9.6 [Aphis craccivora]
MYKTNEKVLNEIDEERIVMNTIMKRTIKLIGYLLRNNEFITIIMEGKIEVKDPEKNRVNPSLKKSSDE